MTLFDAVSAEDMQLAQVVTGAAMALFIGAGLVPGLQGHARQIRRAVLLLYLLACAVLLGRVLLR